MKFLVHQASLFFLAVYLPCSFLEVAAQSSNSSPTQTTLSEINRFNKLSESYQAKESDSALIFAEKANELAEKTNYSVGRLTALNRIGLYYQSKGNYPESMNAYMKAISLSTGGNQQKAVSFLGLAQIYKDMSGDFTVDYTDKAIGYSRNALALYNDLHDTSGMVNSLSMVGILFRDKAKTTNRYYYDSAYVQFSRAIQLLQSTRKPNNALPKLYNNISQVYLEYRKDYKTGLDYLFKAVEENKRINSILGLTHNYGNISDAYIDLKNYKAAVHYAKLMVDGAKAIHRPIRVYFSYKMLSTAYEAARQYDSALAYYKLASDLNDSLSNIKRTRQVVDLQTKYETAKKEADIQTLSKDNAVKSFRIYSLIAALFVLTGTVIGFVVLYRRTKKQKERLDAQSKQLEAANNELHDQKVKLEEVGKVKDKLFSVISHDLRTPVNTLTSFAQLLENDNIPEEKLKSYSAVLRKTLNETSGLMDNLLRWAATQMHGFAPVITKVDVNAVAETVITELSATAAQKQVIVTNSIKKGLHVSADEQMLAVILRNLFSNGIKYVMPVTGVVNISVMEYEKEVRIKVADNGVGMKDEALNSFNLSENVAATNTTPGTKKEQGTGLGLMLCKTLVKLMKGKISACKQYDEGTVFTVSLPSA